MSSEIVEMDVKNPAILRAIIETESSPGQEIREITENAIQAIEARTKKDPKVTSGTVSWQMNPESLSEYGVGKLSCIDTGEGMTPEEMVDRIGRLASSGRNHGLDGNFGVGAKISALKVSPGGVVFDSWQKGKGTRVILIKDGYGSPGLIKVSGRSAFSASGQSVCTKLQKKSMPDLIKSARGTGTVVTLLGIDAQTSNTLLPPDNFSGKKGDWVAWTLNRRYMSFPDNITVRSSLSRSTNPRVFSNITGLRPFLETNSVKKGVLELQGFGVRCHWFKMKEHSDYSGEKSLFDSGAKVGALFNNEIYDYYSGFSGRNQLQHKFGITFNPHRVALLFEPIAAQPTATRSDIKINGEKLPWDDWRSAFKKNMPKPIADIAKKNTSAPFSQSRQMKNLRDYHGRKTIIVKGSGGKIGGVALASRPKRAPGSPRPALGNNSSGSNSTGRVLVKNPAKTILTQGTKKKARRVSLDPVSLEPDCIWGRGSDLGIEDGSVAKYLYDENKLLLNRDADFIKEAERYWVSVKDPDQKDVVKSAVQELFAIQAIDLVVSLRAKESDPGFDKSDLDDEKKFNLGFTSRYFLDKLLSIKLGPVPNR